jgi:hypothetical protein
MKVNMLMYISEEELKFGSTRKEVSENVSK